MATTNESEILKQWLEKLEKELEQKPLQEIMSDNGYAVDDQCRVLGLNLDKTELSDISFLENFSFLTYLSLSSNQISDISPLQGLTVLSQLRLSYNQVSDISPLQGLTALTQLNLNNNETSDISPLRDLKDLSLLNLSHNRISDISPLLPLNQLNRLVLINNKIKGLPREFLQLSIKIQLEEDTGEGIFLDGNPLETPSLEIIKQGTEAVRNYFKELEKESVRLLHCKLLIVGNGEVGKTTLMKKLKETNFQVEVGKEETTHGINIVPWELQCPFEAGDPENVKIHFWDFGGQDIYHATHQFFLTKRSLYLFVWEARKEEESRSFYYWLNIIKLLGAGSPVIAVMNKADLRTKHIDEAYFKDKFDNIAAFLQVSCVTGEGIPELTGVIRQALAQMKHLRDELPKVWMDIREDLKKTGRDYISLTDYFEICKRHGLNEEKAEFLSNYLHDMGVILHYRFDELLENTVILNPEWATEAVYRLVDTREILENKGRFRFQDLKRYWDLQKYPRDIHAQLLRLLEKFELCFPIMGADSHIVPELLPADRPALDYGFYTKPGNLYFQYHYDFMPEGIITRFISRMYYLVVDENYWKNGVELRFEGARALVVSDPLEKKLRITIGGTGQRELLAIIKNDCETIHHTLNMQKNTNYNEMIPCCCSECAPARDGSVHVFPYDMVKKCLEKGIKSIPCARSVEMVEVEVLLKGYESRGGVKNLLTSLLAAARNLQGISKTIRKDEESRNGFIALLLSVNGFHVKTEGRQGSSGPDESTVHPVIKIETPDGQTQGTIKTFRLNSFDRTFIESQVQTLPGCAPGDAGEYFVFVYSECEDFPGSWKKYVQYLDKIDYRWPSAGLPEEIKSGCHGIKAVRWQHRREGEMMDVYHVFIDMKGND